MYLPGHALATRAQPGVPQSQPQMAAVPSGLHGTTASMLLSARQTLPSSEPKGITIDGSNNLTPVLQIVTWILIVIVILAVLVRNSIKFGQTRKLSRDDLLITTSLILAIGQAIAVSLQNANGFGKHIGSLTQHELSTALKCDYAASLLYIASICFAKLTIADFMSKLLASKRSDRWPVQACCVLIVFWTVASIFAAAFRCDLPHVWDYVAERCINQAAFWNSYGVLNVVTDVCLIVAPLNIVFRLQAPLKKRLLVASYFMLRIIVIAAQIIELVYMNQVSDSQDPTFDSWKAELCAEVVLATSIIVSCIPQFKRFLDATESNMLHVDDMRRRGQSGQGYSAQQTPRTRSHISRSGPLSRISNAARALVGGRSQISQSNARSGGRGDGVVAEPAMGAHGNSEKSTSSVHEQTMRQTDDTMAGEPAPNQGIVW